MLNNIFKWIENVWNLRKIFDKYLPQIRELLETVKTLQRQITELRAMRSELENSILLLKSSNKEELQDTEEMAIPYKSNSYYDTEGNGSWDVEINPDNGGTK